MQTEKVILNVPEGYKGEPIEVVFREGSASTINEPKGWSHEKVSVQSMFNYIVGNHWADDVKDNPGIVTYSLAIDNFWLKFDQNPADDLAPTLFGALELTEEFKAFGINKERYFQGKSLINLIRKYAYCFVDIKHAESLIKQLQNFEVVFEQKVKEEDDRVGNTKKHRETSLRFAAGNVALEWLLKMPIFKGTAEVEFKVSLEIEERSGLPAFAFFSMETDIMQHTLGKAIIEAEVDKFKQHFVVLETY